MTQFLHIETATDICSVAISEEGKLLAAISSEEKRAHAAQLTVFIEHILKEANLKPSQLDAISVSKGPGSYTGLRIGVSVAKGLCFALQKPLIGIPTLAAFAAAASAHFPGDVLLCPMIDARRMEVYYSIFDHSGKTIQPTVAEIITESTFAPALRNNSVVFFGDGMNKCKPLLRDFPNAKFWDDFEHHASWQALLALDAFHQQKFEDVALFEPYYLKEFIAKKPGEKIRRVLNG